MTTSDKKVSVLCHGADKHAPTCKLDKTTVSASRSAIEELHTARGSFSAGWGTAILIVAVLVITVLAVPVLRQENPQQILQNVAEPDTTGTEHSGMQAADSAPFAVYTPEMWEVKIARMIAEGNITEAEAELGMLRQAFPDHKINPSLLENLNTYYE